MESIFALALCGQQALLRAYVTANPTQMVWVCLGGPLRTKNCRLGEKWRPWYLTLKFADSDADAFWEAHHLNFSVF